MSLDAYSGPPMICSTDQFWQKMCHAAFVRIDLHRGAIGNRRYYCATPPEHVEGFLLAKSDDIIKMMVLPPSVWERIRATLTPGGT